MATPSLEISRPKPPLGSPVDITYKFIIAQDAPALAQDYWVMVHFVDPDREQMWTDDHQPPTPTSQWKAGQTISYTRTLFIPVFPYVGPATIEVGLFSPTAKERLRLNGTDEGQRSYRVAAIELRPQNENLFLVYKDGWHPAEVAADTNAVAWQWTKGDATLTFRNPHRDVTLYLDVDSPVAGVAGGQKIGLLVGGTAFDEFSLEPRQRLLRRSKITAAQLGSGDTVELRVHVDKTIVPAKMPNMHSSDPRELGIRVFHAFVQPE